MSLENAPTMKSKPIRGLHVAANSEVEIDGEDVKKKQQGTAVTLINEIEEKLIITPYLESQLSTPLEHYGIGYCETTTVQKH